MMPNVSRGSRMHGLMGYLAGPGRANEHTNPHLVAGDGLLMSWYGGDELSAQDAQSVARYLNAPTLENEVTVKAGHVWHCSLSLAASEGELSDARWAQIAQDFVAEMGWSVSGSTRVLATSVVAPGAAGSDAGSRVSGAAGGVVEAAVSTDPARRAQTALRWAAVRHGVSKNGNDHVHLVVNLVGEDGKVAGTYNDFLRAQAAARAMEKKHGLVQLVSAQRGVATRGWKPAEREAAARRVAMAKVEHARLHGGAAHGWVDLSPAARKAEVITAAGSAGGPLGLGMNIDQPRRVLEVAVRGAATASRTEGEFVRRLRDAGVLVRPRFAEGGTTAVEGFSVALRPQFGSALGEHPVWFGGGTLARDLTLPRLRGGWQRDEASSAAAVGEWRAAARARRSVTPPAARRERKVFTAEQAVAHSRKVAAMGTRLGQVPASDRPLWAKVAGMSAGTLSAWAMEAARSTDPATAAMAPALAGAAQVLSRSAQTVAPTPSSFAAGTTSLSGVAMLLASAARGGRGAVGQAVLLAQMITLVEAVAQMAAARHELDVTRDLRVQVQGRLVGVEQMLSTAALGAGQDAGQGAGPSAGQGAGSAQRAATGAGPGNPYAAPVAGASTPSVTARVDAAPGMRGAGKAPQDGAVRAAASMTPTAPSTPSATPLAAPSDAPAVSPKEGAWAARWRAHQEAERARAAQVQKPGVAPTSAPMTAPTAAQAAQPAAEQAAAAQRQRAAEQQREQERQQELEHRRRAVHRGPRDRGGPSR